ncbi:MAG: imidazolonepropionase [Calditrichaeota bacterium]|nr:imidazolonepropionase [Calditrichota bacterium]
MTSLVSDGTCVLDAQGRVALPGFVDCHAHPVFVGERSHEFHRRNAGATYQQIAREGGGIAASARALANASIEDIMRESSPRLDRFLLCGTTTLEAKSGYGLFWDQEKKQLEAIRELSRSHPMELVPTFLVHAIPSSVTNRKAFMDEICQTMLPTVAEERLAEAVDIFCEEGAFTVEESRRILLRARELGLRIKIHANQFGHSGGARLAAELGAMSADHLEYLKNEEIAALVEKKIICVLLPACVFFLGNPPYPPARKLIEKGARVAIATDMNPGSSMTESLPLCQTIAAIYCHMSSTELLWAVTYDAARALQREHQIGSLEVGKEGNVTLWDIPHLDYLSYHFGISRPTDVIIKGQIVVSHGQLRHGN